MPLVGGAVMVTLVGSMVPSLSLSLPRTGMLTEPSSSTLAVSSLAAGASFTSVTVTFTVAVSQAPSSSQTS